jgi:hypothetical protein
LAEILKEDSKLTAKSQRFGFLTAAGRKGA